jgi:hypothetical protein
MDIKKLVIQFLKKTNSVFEDFDIDDEITEEITQIDVDVETQRINVTFPNRWTDKNENVVITPLELILFIIDKK